MDGYLDPYYQTSAAYYAPRYPSSYALERRSTHGLPSVDPLSSYARDTIAGYGASALYQPEIALPPRYVSAPASLPFRPRPRSTPNKRKDAPSQYLTPKKKPFKQTQKVRFSETKERPFSKKDKPSQPVLKRSKTDAKVAPTSQATSLVKETQELHKLFRTGVDSNKGKPKGKKVDPNGMAKKRKADKQAQKPTPTNQKNLKSAKKQKGKKEKDLSKDMRVRTVKAELPPPTEEELKEAEAALELQREVCKSVGQFLGILETKEVAVADGVEPDGKVEESKEPLKDSMETDKDSETMDKDSKATDEDSKEPEKKPEEPQRTPEEEKEIEAKSLKFFSDMFSQHQDLKNLYIEHCNSGSFECLVCHSVDATKSKKFWNVVSLVTHTKMRKQLRPEHSGYGRAVSAVLGWDHDKTPQVPRGKRPFTPVQKSADQGQDAKKQEDVEKVADQDLKVTEASPEENKEEENASECPSEDVKEEGKN